MASRSIIFRIGGDLSGLQKDMGDAQKMVVKSAEETKAKVKAASKSAFGSVGLPGKTPGKEGGGREEHGSGNRAIGDALDAATGQRGWVMRMNMLSHSLPIAALAGGAIAVEKMTEALEKMNEADKAARAELARPLEIAVAKGPESVKESIAAIDKVRKDLQDSRTLMATMGGIVMNPLKALGNKLSGQHLFDTDGTAESLKLENQLIEKKFVLSARLTEKTKVDTAARTAALHVGKEELAVYEAEQATQKKIADIKGDDSILPDAKHALIAQAQQEGQDAIDAAKASRAENLISLQVEQAAVRAKKEGADVEIKSLETRLRAERDIASVVESQQEKNKHNAAADALQVELDQARKVSLERKTQLSIETQVADLRGDADEKHAMQLDLENEDLKERLKNAKPDEKRGIQRDLSRNEEARLASAAAMIQKNARLRDSEIDAMPGEGAGYDRRKNAAHLANAMQELAALKGAPGAQKGDIDETERRIADLNREMAESQRLTQETASSTEEQNRELEQEIQNHKAIAEVMREQFDFQKKIVEARRNEKFALAEALTRERDLTLEKRKEAEADKSRATIAELAAHARNQDGAAARRAMRLHEEAERQRVRGNEKGARELQEKANRIIGGDPAEAQRLMHEARKFWDKPGEGNHAHARDLEAQARKLQKGIGPAKNSEKVEQILNDLLISSKNIEQHINGVGTVR